MKTRPTPTYRQPALLAVLLLPLFAGAQVPVDDAGNPIGEFGALGDGAYAAADTADAVGGEGIPLLEASELEELVGPIALYPDDLLAIVLPASTYPLQVVQAARFLDALETDPALEPDPDWDDAIVALVNYPEVVELLNEDLDWTWRLGEAVVAQEPDVVRAVARFRNRAYAAGNLQSDGYQNVREDEGLIEITPVTEDVIYVPYYEPERVVYRQPHRVYYYYPTAYPVYYYPYPSSYAFHSGFFWGVTTAFTIGWHSDHLRVFHHSYRGHPYFGRSYWDRWWYRRPTISVYNHIYAGNRPRSHSDYYVRGDRWRPSRRLHVRHAERDTYTRSRGYYNNRDAHVRRPGERLRTERAIDASRHRLSNVRIVEGRDDVSRAPQRTRVRPERTTAVPERTLPRVSVHESARQVEPRDRRVDARDSRRTRPTLREPARRDAGIERRSRTAAPGSVTRSRATPTEPRHAVRSRPARQSARAPARSAPPVKLEQKRSPAPAPRARQETRGGQSAIRSRRR